MSVQQEFETQAEEDANVLMVYIEAGRIEDARDVVSRIADEQDGVTRMAWLIMQLAAGLHGQEALTHGLEVMLGVTNGIDAAGLSRAEIALVAFEADRRREASNNNRKGAA